MVLQVYYNGNWYYVAGINSHTVATTYDKHEALSDEYMGMIAAKFTGMKFRSV